MIQNVRCPHCASDAIYGYGRVKNGKKRYLCLMCNRQFVLERKPPLIKDRPTCPLCGGRMHIYMRKGREVRFRCAAYPDCRGYLKMMS